MINIGIVSNMDKDTGLAYTREIIMWLIERDCQPFVCEKLSEKLGMPEYACNETDMFTKTQFLVVLGGDGTILRVARTAALYNKPLMGINLGTLGYLTDVEKADGTVALGKVLNGEYKLEKRMMLEVSGANIGDGEQTSLALNDVCVSKGVFSKLITLELYINNEYTDTFRADGIIFSTPTGSTAYNLSAGGPILKPDGEMIAITPICPHSLYTRSWVISAGDVITLKVSEHADEILLVLDGQKRTSLLNDDIITVSRSKYYSRIIKTNEQSFYDILRQKLVKK